jgi:hypothetical protein
MQHTFTCENHDESTIPQGTIDNWQGRNQFTRRRGYHNFSPFVEHNGSVTFKKVASHEIPILPFSPRLGAQSRLSRATIRPLNLLAVNTEPLGALLPPPVTTPNTPMTPSKSTYLP